MTTDKSVNNDGKITLFEFFRNNPDRVIIGNLPEFEATPQTGMGRLKKMFSLDIYGEQSKEVVMITQSFLMTTFGGAIIGSVVQSRAAFVNFLQNNQATKFANQMEAKRELQRVMYLAFAKGAWKWGSRIGLFATTFTTLTTTVSVYRGRDSLVEYIVAGGATGALFKMNMGLKGTFSGCLAGSFIGGIGGAASLLVLEIGGTSMDEIRSFCKHLKDYRAAAIRHKQAQSTLEDNPELKDVMDSTGSLENLEPDEQIKEP